MATSNPMSDGDGDDKTKAASKYKGMTKKEPLMVEKADGSIGQWGNDVPPSPAPKRRIKLSNAPNDDMDHDEAQKLADEAPMHNQYKQDLKRSISNNQVTPDQGDIIKALKKAKGPAQAPSMPSMPVK